MPGMARGGSSRALSMTVEPLIFAGQVGCKFRRLHRNSQRHYELDMTLDLPYRILRQVLSCIDSVAPKVIWFSNSNSPSGRSLSPIYHLVELTLPGWFSISSSLPGLFYSCGPVLYPQLTIRSSKAVPCMPTSLTLLAAHLLTFSSNYRL